MRLHVTADGLGRSMCSRHCQCEIFGNRNPLHRKALLVYVAATTCWEIKSGNYIMWILPLRIVIFVFLAKVWLAWQLWCCCTRLGMQFTHSCGQLLRRSRQTD